MTDQSSLKVEIDNLTRGSSKFGIYAHHPKTGFVFGYNAETLFDMASTYKIPIAVHCLKLAEKKVVGLSQVVRLTPTDQRPGTGLEKPLISNQDEYKDFSLHELIRIMLQYSDNTATDAVLRAVGGPPAVMQTMEEIGIQDLRVDKDSYDFFTEQIGVQHLIQKENFSIENFKKIEKSLTPEYIKYHIDQYDKHLYDAATPKAMGTLLDKIVHSNILSSKNRNLLLSIMADCRTFRNRIPAFLPKDIKIHRKTGSLSHVANDVAIIDVPQGYLILVIFCRYFYKSSADKDRTVALVAKSIFDSFVSTHILKDKKCDTSARSI